MEWKNLQNNITPIKPRSVSTHLHKRKGTLCTFALDEFEVEPTETISVNGFDQFSETWYDIMQMAYGMDENELVKC